jgi:very-short-patch-repair endonuclease
LRERARVRGSALPIPPDLLVFARQLRKGQTDAEKMLWYLLRGCRFCGFKFRRQYPLYGYILDFYCHDAGLAVELDGGGHNYEDQRLYDEERTKALEAANIRVIRFWNNDVLNSFEEVLEELLSHLKASPSSGQSLSLSLPQRGRVLFALSLRERDRVRVGPPSPSGRRNRLKIDANRIRE